MIYPRSFSELLAGARTWTWASYDHIYDRATSERHKYIFLGGLWKYCIRIITYVCLRQCPYGKTLERMLTLYSLWNSKGRRLCFQYYTTTNLVVFWVYTQHSNPVSLNLTPYRYLGLQLLSSLTTGHAAWGWWGLYSRTSGGHQVVGRLL